VKELRSPSKDCHFFVLANVYLFVIIFGES